jgi:hypothetical protein
VSSAVWRSPVQQRICLDGPFRSTRIPPDHYKYWLPVVRRPL